MPYKATKLDARIWSVLKREGPLSTRELADRVGADTKTVYQRCSRMEREFKRKKWIESQPRLSDRRLYFFPATGDVLTHSSQPRIAKTIQDLKGIARQHAVKRGAQLPDKVKNVLRRDYRKYLQDLAADLPERERQQVQSFEGQLMAVLNGTRLSAVVGLMGLRGFRPKIRVWWLRGGAPASLPGFPTDNHGPEPEPSSLPGTETKN
jgi:DNA-binding Lrp family transcriptional regulator